MLPSQSVTGIFKEIELRTSRIGTTYYRITLKLDNGQASMFQIWDEEWIVNAEPT